MRSLKRARFASAAALAAVAVSAPAISAPASQMARAAEALEAALLQVEVNGVAQAEPVAVLRGNDGELYVPRAVIASLRMAIRAPRLIVHQGETYVALKGAEALTFSIDEETQVLSITASPELLGESWIDLRDGGFEPMTPSSLGGFFNYELLGELSAGAMSFAGAFEAGVFARHGFGTSRFTMSRVGRETRLTRLDSTWTIDDPQRMRSLRLGDAVTRSGVGGTPVRFGGIQFASNFGVQSGFITLPLPTIEGSAALPSVVDLYVNNSLRSSTDVTPGPFRVTDIPIVTGGGDVQLIVRDTLGRESVIRQSYYASPKLLRKGLHEHSTELGFLRRNYARRSADYGDLMGSTTHRYGVSDRFTAEGHIEGSARGQSAGLAGAVLVSSIGLVEGSAAMSRSDRGMGRMIGFGFERRMRGLSLGGRGEFTSRDYRTIGAPENRMPPSKVIQLFAGMPTGFGSLAASYTLRDGRSEPDAEIITTSASFRLGRLGSLYLSGRRNLRGERDSGAEAGIVIPLGRRTSVNASIQRFDGRNSVTANLQKNPPAGDGIGYRVSAAAGESERLSGRFTLQLGSGKYDAEAAMLDGKWGARAVVSGGIGLVRGQVFAARQLSQSFGVVRVGSFPDVRIYADNQVVGRTNSKGIAIVPRLRPFDRNRIEIETSDLPIDAMIGEPMKIIRPHDRSGVSVDFDAAESNGGILKVLLADGSAARAGSTLRLDGGLDEFVVAPGGEVYVTGLKPRSRATLTLADQTCAFEIVVPATKDRQPNLGSFTCRD